MPKDLPDDPVLLTHLLEQMLSERESDKGKIVHLEEENALLRQRLFGRKSEQTADPATPQMALFNEAESEAEPVDETVEEEVVAPTRRRGKREPLPADLPRIEVIHELPRARADLRLPQARRWRGNQRAAGDLADANPCDQTCVRVLRLAWAPS